MIFVVVDAVGEEDGVEQVLLVGVESKGEAPGFKEHVPKDDVLI